MRVVDEFLAIGGNHDLEEYDKYRNKMLDFLREEDHLILPPDDKNLVLARDVIFFIDASKIYALETNSKEAYPPAKPFLERMLASDFNDWHYYDLALLISSINFTESFEQARQLASKAEKQILQFKRVRTTGSLQAALACNMCARILNAKYLDRDEPATFHFENWMGKLKLLANDDKDFELLWLVAQLRWNIYNIETKQMKATRDHIVSRFDEKIGIRIKNEVDFYFDFLLKEPISKERRKSQQKPLKVGGEA